MIDLLRNRRSIRRYKTKAIEKEKLVILEEAVLRSPTSRNFKPTRFVFVLDKKTIEDLSAAKQHGASFLTGAPLCVVVCGDENVSDVWVEDASIASILLQCTAQSLGLGSCWIQIRKRQQGETSSSEEYVQKKLGLPHHLRVESLIAIGYPDEQKEPVKLGQEEKTRVQYKSDHV